MRIMCLNGWGGRLYADLSAYIGSEQPDILCLQEVTHSPETTEEWLDYRDGGASLPQRANLFRDIASLLPDHVATFCPAAQGVLWNGDQAVPSQWGLATFVHASLPVIAQAHGFVHGQFSPDGYGDHPRSRTAHAVRIHDFASGRPLTVAHMHGLRDPRGKMDTEARRRQAERLLQLVASVAEPQDPTVVCGDFNVEPESETLSLCAEAGFTELVTSRGHAGTRSSHYPKPGRFADYMLVNRHVDVLDFSVLRNPEVSDHCPLLLTL